MTNVVHMFGDDLRRSESHEEFWKAAYKRAFPDFAGWLANQNDNLAQRLGIDHVILLNSGALIRIDEKTRPGDLYPRDLLIEISHRYGGPNEGSTERRGGERKPGWIEKDLQIDYVAYGFIREGRAMLIEWRALRLAWRQHRDDWCRRAEFNSDGFRKVPAENPQYTTWSIAVPRCVLFDALSDARTIEVSP